MPSAWASRATATRRNHRMNSARGGIVLARSQTQSEGVVSVLTVHIKRGGLRRQTNWLAASRSERERDRGTSGAGGRKQVEGCTDNATMRSPSCPLLSGYGSRTPTTVHPTCPAESQNRYVPVLLLCVAQRCKFSQARSFERCFLTPLALCSVFRYSTTLTTILGMIER